MRGSVVKIAGNVATLLFAVVIVLQILLALGVLPVTMAWGGTQTELTTALRFSSLAAIALLIAFAFVIRRRAGLIGQPPIPTYFKLASWVVTAYLALNALGNLRSPSVNERLVFGSITVLLVIACFIVSISRE